MILPMRLALLIVAVACLVRPAGACLWDYDTLRDEQRGLPTVAAVLAGKFERHADFYYEQRVRRMREHLDAEPGDLNAVDNLAVALEKLGRLDEAVATLEPVVAEHPERYTALANLGTFRLHRWLRDRDRADLDAGIGLIRRAIEVNPDAHFGREKYQLMLAEHVRDGLDDPSVLERGSFVVPMLVDRPSTRPADLRDAMAMKRDGRGDADDAEVNDAITGVVGMIRFGTGTSPHLYRALGDLLAARGDKHLSAWAYLRAIEFGHPRADDVGDEAEQVISTIGDEPSLAHVRADLDAAIAEADAWVAAFRQHEDAILRRGDDPMADGAMAGFYAEHGDPRLASPRTVADVLSRDPVVGGLGILLVSVGAIILLGRLWLRRRSLQGGAFA